MLPSIQVCLELVRQTVHPHVHRLRIHEIKRSATPAVIYRLTLEKPSSAVSGGPPASLILKCVEAEWPDDPNGPDREPNFYATLADQLDLAGPAIFFAGCDPTSRQRLVLMEDLSGYHLPNVRHIWKAEEARCFLRTYARLHSQGAALLTNGLEPPGWLFPRHERDLQIDRLASLHVDLVQAKFWPEIPRFVELLTWIEKKLVEFSRSPKTLLHNDVFPPNIALPRDLERGEAILLDWEMVGLGPAELDLSFLFMQPFQSSRELDRRSMLEYYWHERQRWDGVPADASERVDRQLIADAVWALWLVRVAHRVWRSPFPAGSLEAQYWQAMAGVLHSKLTELADGV